MIIDTNKRVVAVQLRRLLTLIGVIVLALAIVLLSKLPNTFLGLNKYHWAIVVGILYILSNVVEAVFQFHYIYFHDETDKIIIRFFSLGFSNKKKQSIEIPKAEFTSFVLQESLWGFKRKIVLRRLYKNVEAKYPPIPLTILDKEQLAQLLLSLDRHSRKGSKK